MAGYNKNLWAPWRMDYIRSLREEADESGCFLCRYWQQPQCDRENHVLWRSSSSFVVMNRFPYTNGHLLIALSAHKGDVVDLVDNEMLELSRAARDAVAVLRETIAPQGFNIGYNLGLCAGAGLPDHLHAHVVPRWNGDTNMMSVIGDSRVIPDSLDALYAELSRSVEARGLR